MLNGCLSKGLIPFEITSKHEIYLRMGKIEGLKDFNGLEIQLSMCMKKKFGTSPVPRMLNYSTEDLDLPGHCKYLPVSSLRIKKNAIIFPGKKQIPERYT